MIEIILSALKSIINKIANIVITKFFNKLSQKDSFPQSLTLIPNPKSNFIGRKKELKYIEDKLKENNVLLIKGIGGIGKSTLVLHYLKIHKKKFNHYGYIPVFNDIKTNMVSALNKLNPQGKNIDEKFQNALMKLQELKGEKLLIIDDIRNVENQKDAIDKLLWLLPSNWKLLLTSRESIEDINQYELNKLSLEEARELFIQHSGIKTNKKDEKINAILNTILKYLGFKTDNKDKINDILEYLDRHTLFIELTAKSLKKNKKLTLDELLNMFKKGELPAVKTSRKENFNDYLRQRFKLDGLDEEQILLLKKLSLMPSIEIPYETLESFFDMENLGWLLDELRDKGWLTGDRNNYKIHQIIKEFILNNHTPTYKETKDLIDNINNLLKNSADPQTAVDNRDNIVYFESVASALLQKDIVSEDIAKFFLNLANIYSGLGEYKKALPFFKKALKLQKEKLGENHLDTATTYNNLASVYYFMGKYEKAFKFFKKSLDIREKTLGETHPDTVTSYSNIAELYKAMGKYKKALLFHKKALEIQKKVLGEEHLDTTTSYNNLAGLYKAMGKYEEALPLYKKALEIQKEKLGKEHPNIAIIYNNIAELYKAMGKYKKALPLYKKALEIQKEKLGEKHPNTATTYYNLAFCYSNLKKYQEAYNYMKKAVEIGQKIFPASHPNLITIQENLKLIEKKLK